MHEIKDLLGEFFVTLQRHFSLSSGFLDGRSLHADLALKQRLLFVLLGQVSSFLQGHKLIFNFDLRDLLDTLGVVLRHRPVLAYLLINRLERVVDALERALHHEIAGGNDNSEHDRHPDIERNSARKKVVREETTIQRQHISKVEHALNVEPQVPDKCFISLVLEGYKGWF